MHAIFIEATGQGPVTKKAKLAPAPVAEACEGSAAVRGQRPVIVAGLS